MSEYTPEQVAKFERMQVSRRKASANYAKAKPEAGRRAALKHYYKDGSSLAKARYLRIKREFLSAYGGKCSCCGEVEEKFLTVGHPNGNGAEHRKQFKSSTALILHLKAENWPKGEVEIQCWNCNEAERYYKVCPHKEAVKPMRS